MKVSERFPPDDPREWLNRARSNIAIAKNRVPEAYLEDLCFEAQQASEKAIKAVMISHDISFPYVHDLGLLLSILKEKGVSVTDTVRRAARLTPYAAENRYPGTAGPVAGREYSEAVEIAEAVVRWAEETLRRQ